MSKAYRKIAGIIIKTEEAFIKKEPDHQGLLEAKAEAYDKIRCVVGGGSINDWTPATKLFEFPTSL